MSLFDKRDNIDLLVFKNIFDIERMSKMCSDKLLSECFDTLTVLVSALDYLQYTLFLQDMEDFVKNYVPNGWKESNRSVYSITITYQEFIYILFTDDLSKTKRPISQIEPIEKWLTDNNAYLKVSDFRCPYCGEKMRLTKLNLVGKYVAKCEDSVSRECPDIVDPDCIPNVLKQLIEYSCERTK